MLKKIPILAVLVVASLLLPGLTWAGGKDLSWGDVPADQIMASGLIRIIVMLDVPDISALSAASSTFKAGQASPREAANVAIVDSALADGIANVARAVHQSLQTKSTGASSAPVIFKTVPGMALTVDQAGLDLLKADSRVLSIQLDEPTPLPMPAKSGEMMKIDSNSPKSINAAPAADTPNLADSIPLVGADKVWAKGYTGSGWYVAILDTGIRSGHEMFTGKTLVEACFSNPAHCPNGLSSMYGPGAAAHHPNTYAGFDHGTHVSGIAAGKRPNGTLNGVAKDANIINVNIFSKFDNTGDVRSYSSDQILGLEYIYNLRGTYNIGAVNMSLGGGQYFAYCDNDARKAAIDNLKSVRIATCISSGNNGYCDSVGAPGCISTAVTVGASSKGDIEANFNNWQPQILDVFAPGVSITSSTGDSNSSYEAWDGTSMAAPHVTGAWTLMRQHNPAESVDSIRTKFVNNGKSVATTCSNQTASRPRINVFNALTGKSIITPQTKLLMNY